MSSISNSISDETFSHVGHIAYQAGRLSVYELFKLKNEISRTSFDKAGVKAIRQRICVGKTFVYFDEELNQEESILIEEILEKGVRGKRKTDSARIHIPIESMNVDAKMPIRFKDRQSIDMPYMLENWDRVAIYGHSGSTFLLAYVVKFNFGGSHFRLLGGERVTLSNSNLYWPTKTELKLFDRFERNKEIQGKIYQQAQAVVDEYMEKSKQIKVGQLSSRLRNLGFSPEHVERAVKEKVVMC